MKNIPYILLSMILGILVFGYLLFNSNLPFQFKDQAKFLRYVDYSLANGSLLGGVVISGLNFYSPKDDGKKNDSQLTFSSLSLRLDKGIPTIMGKGIFIQQITGSNGEVDVGPAGQDRFELFKKSLPESVVNFPNLSLGKLLIRKFKVKGLKNLEDINVNQLELLGLNILPDRFSVNKFIIDSNMMNLEITKPKEVFFHDDEFSFTGLLKQGYFPSLIKPTLLRGNVYLAKKQAEYELFIFNDQLRAVYKNGLQAIDIEYLNTADYIANVFPITKLKLKIRRSVESGQLETLYGSFYVGKVKLDIKPGPLERINGDLVFTGKTRVKGKVIETMLFPFKFNKTFRYTIKFWSPTNLSVSEMMALLMYEKSFDDLDLDKIAIIQKQKLLLAL